MSAPSLSVSIVSIVSTVSVLSLRVDRVRLVASFLDRVDHPNRVVVSVSVASTEACCIVVDCIDRVGFVATCGSSRY